MVVKRSAVASRRVIAWRDLRVAMTAPFMIALAIALLINSHHNPIAFQSLRGVISDSLAPVLSALSRPGATVANWRNGMAQRRDMVASLAVLQQEKRDLLQWRDTALRLEAENRSLRGLLAYPQPEATASITGRVIADPASIFNHSVLVQLGIKDGVETGMAAMTGQGMVGNVIEAGNTTARVLLLTDLNARFPVVTETSRHRAILTGDNSAWPRLEHLAPNAVIAVGERVVTSGEEGQLPAGLPIGVVVALRDGEAMVQPFADLGRLEHLRLIKSLPGRSELVKPVIIPLETEREAELAAEKASELTESQTDSVPSQKRP